MMTYFPKMQKLKETLPVMDNSSVLECKKKLKNKNFEVFCTFVLQIVFLVLNPSELKKRVILGNFVYLCLKLRYKTVPLVIQSRPESAFFRNTLHSFYSFVTKVSLFAASASTGVQTRSQLPQVRQA